MPFKVASLHSALNTFVQSPKVVQREQFQTGPLSTSDNEWEIADWISKDQCYQRQGLQASFSNQILTCYLPEDQ